MAEVGPTWTIDEDLAVVPSYAYVRDEEGTTYRYLGGRLLLGDRLVARYEARLVEHGLAEGARIAILMANEVPGLGGGRSSVVEVLKFGEGHRYRLAESGYLPPGRRVRRATSPTRDALIFAASSAVRQDPRLARRLGVSGP